MLALLVLPTIASAEDILSHSGEIPLSPIRSELSPFAFASSRQASCIAGSCMACDQCSACSPCDCVWCREELTGDWWEKRTCLAENGIVIDSSLTQFYQGVTSGG